MRESQLRPPGLSLRQATLDDIEDMLDIGTMYAAELHDKPAELDLSALTLSLISSTVSPRGFILLALDDLEVVGALWGSAAEYSAWSHDLSALDHIFYIKPEYRGYALAKEMVSLWEGWAKSVGCKRVYLSSATGESAVKTGRLYNHLGYALRGVQYDKEI